MPSKRPREIIGSDKHGLQSEGRPLPEFDIERQSSVAFDGRFLKPGALVDSPNPMMPLLDAICTRRTSRAYSQERVDEATFEWIVKHAMHVPTACNEQAWKVIYIDDPATINDLYERGSASFLSNVGQCFLICYNRQSNNMAWQDHIQSGAAFITAFQLLAHSVGIGSCWIGHLPNKSEIRRLFKVHRGYEPVALVSFGYYRDRVNTLPRKHDVSHVIMHNSFDSEGLIFRGTRRTIFRTIARYVYYKVPAFLRRRLKKHTLRFEKKFYYENFD